MLSHFYWGIVTDNADSEKRDRVKVRKEDDESGTSEWVPVALFCIDVDVVLESIIPEIDDNDVSENIIPEVGELVMVATFYGIDESKRVLRFKRLNEGLPPETEEITCTGLEKAETNIDILICNSCFECLAGLEYTIIGPNGYEEKGKTGSNGKIKSESKFSGVYVVNFDWYNYEMPDTEIEKINREEAKHGNYKYRNLDIVDGCGNPIFCKVGVKYLLCVLEKPIGISD